MTAQKSPASPCFGRTAGSFIAFAFVALLSVEARAQPTEISGVWRIESPVSQLRTIDGDEPPLTAAAAKTYREHIAARKLGDSSFDSATWCAAPGMPRIMLINRPFEIMARPHYVGFLHEWNWWARIVYLEGALSGAPSASGVNDPPPAGPPPSGLAGPPPPGPRPLDSGALPGPMGLSKGSWDGDTLVVETTELIDGTLIDASGLPHSSELRLVEKIRLRSPDVLEDRIRFEDPSTFTRPWETVVTYRRQRGVNIKEDVCLDRIKAGEPAVKE